MNKYHECGKGYGPMTRRQPAWSIYESKVPNPSHNGKDKASAIAMTLSMGKSFLFLAEQSNMIDVTKEEAQEHIKRGILLGFVPSKLEIEGRPELSVFSLNVMFMQQKNENGKVISGTALYEPDVESHTDDGSVCTLRYHNIYGGDSHLMIHYYKNDKRYVGFKYVNGQSIGSAAGNNWQNFFLHFTMIGLVNGEQCEFEVVGKM